MKSFSLMALALLTMSAAPALIKPQLPKVHSYANGSVLPQQGADEFESASCWQQMTAAACYAQPHCHWTGTRCMGWM